MIKPQRNKSFKEVLDEHISEINTNTYFALLKAHDRELSEDRELCLNTLERIKNTYKRETSWRMKIRN